MEDGAQDVFVYDRKTKRTQLISRASNGGPGGDGDSAYPSISVSGRYVAFHSNATNLSGANLNGANLTQTNLKGATGMSTTTLTGVIWSKTTCPDNTNSNTDGGTCLGHF